jgi:transporter family-2 protein
MAIVPVEARRRVGKAMVTFLIGVALVMGLFMAIQPAINLELRRFVGSPAQAAMVSTFVSTISLGFFVFVIQRKPWPSLAAAQSTPWWIWIGGLLGAAYVAISVVLVSRLGTAFAFSLVVLGQMVTALLIDRFGWFGVPIHDLTPGRLIGVALVISGVVLIRMF